MREICTSGSTRGELVAHPCRLLSYSTGSARDHGNPLCTRTPLPKRSFDAAFRVHTAWKMILSLSR